MKERFFRIVEPRKSKRNIVGNLSIDDIYDYLTYKSYFNNDGYVDTYEKCLEYKFKLANMFRAMAEEIECCEIKETEKPLDLMPLFEDILKSIKIMKDELPEEKRGLLYGIKIRKVNTNEHKEATEGNKEEI